MNKLKIGHFSKAGRNSKGRITVQGQGSGNKINYKLIDFKKNIWNVPGIILKFTYDPIRTPKLALVLYNNGILSYQIAIENTKIGQILISGPEVPVSIGNSLPLYAIPSGIPICLIQTNYSNATLCRSSGTFATIIKKDFQLGYAIIALKSGIYKGVPLNCMATIGQISISKKIIKKAGSSRWIGIRPTVRGTAKNPVDHPHGGGNGKTSGGRISVTPHARLTKGKKTRYKSKNLFHQTSYIG